MRLIVLTMGVFISLCSSIYASDSIVIEDEKSNWVLFKKVDPFTDEAVLDFILKSDDKVGARFGNEWATLHIRISEGGIDIYVNWNQFVTTESAEVKYRVDKKVPQVGNWSMSTNYEATFSSNPEELFEDLLSAENFIISVVPHGENPVVARFDIKGLEKFWVMNK